MNLNLTILRPASACIRGVIGAACLCLSLSATAQPQPTATDKAFDVANLMREVESAVSSATGLPVRASASTLREGEALVLTIDVPRPGYLNVISINPAGDPVVLFPNSLQPDNKVAAGAFALPTPQMPFELRASAPFGESRVVALLSAEPMNLDEIGRAVQGGKPAERFAQLSTAGRDLINLLTTRNLLGDAKQRPLAAGMTTVLICAKTGPCESPSGDRIRRIVDAIVPGIFLDKDADLAEAKSIVELRPVYERGVALTKLSEGFVRTLYEDAAGYCTIAYGHLLKRAACDRTLRSRYPRGITEPEGGALLVSDMALAQRAVMAYVKVPLDDGQYAALVDFTFNVGAGNLKRSTLLKAINAGEHHRVPYQLLRWTKAGGRELRGLRTRREREIALYFEHGSLPKAMPKGEIVTPVDIRTGEGAR